MRTAEVTNARAAAIRHARRLSGQVGALPVMVAADRPLADVAQQVVAARGSLDSLLLRLIELELSASAQTRQSRVAVDQCLRLALGHGRARPSSTLPPNRSD
jgi:DNA-binding FrmR family transcriptional regulator